MKKLLFGIFLSFGIGAFAQEVPKVQKTKFSEEALAQKLITQQGKKLSVKEVLQQHQGKIVIIDFWASWCRDCILALPKTSQLTANNPNVHFVYFSLDRSMEQWKRGLDKYDIDDKENYWFDEGWKNNFNNFIDLNWVPRFMVVDQKGDIAKYYAIAPDDPEIQQTIDRLTNQQ